MLDVVTLIVIILPQEDLSLTILIKHKQFLMQPISEVRAHATKLGDDLFRWNVPGLHKYSFQYSKCKTVGSIENKNIKNC